MEEFLFESSQDVDTYIQIFKRKPFRIRCASVRSSDSREHEQPGQDFVTFQHDAGGLTFAICDGVSQSFHGDYAAQYLGRRLLDWTPRAVRANANPEAMRTQLGEYLNNITCFAGEEVANMPIPAETPELLKQVLEEKRALGSESTFICGRLELPRPELPFGAAFFAYMGDSRLRLSSGEDWVAQPRLSDQGELNDGMSRWSTRKGAVGGRPSVMLVPLVKGNRYNLIRVLAYTDGLGFLDDMSSRPSDKQLDRIIATEVESVNNDDCSLIEIELF